MASNDKRAYWSGFFGGVVFEESWKPKSKAYNVRTYISYMLARTQSMFEYDGLPETIPQRSFELMLQTNGNVCVAEYGGSLYAFVGGPGGEPDVYYMPTIYVVANPALKMSETYKIGENCVMIGSDSLYMGLMPMFRRYATQLVESDLSMHIATVMQRVLAMLSASDDKTKKSAEKYINDIFEGQLGIVAESAFLDGIRAQPLATSNTRVLTELIEQHQYIKASWLNDIGLNANFNMKREALNSSESSLNQDSLLPLVDDMLRCRQRGVEAVNAMFGTNISVKLSSSWEDNQQEIEAEHAAILAGAGVAGEEPTDEVADDTSEDEPETTEDKAEETTEEETSLEEKAEELIEAAEEIVEEVSGDEMESAPET